MNIPIWRVSGLHSGHRRLGVFQNGTVEERVACVYRKVKQKKLDKEEGAELFYHSSHNMAIIAHIE
jgi:hypothetical protein